MASRSRESLLAWVENRDPSTWPEVDVESIPEPARSLYITRQRAIRGWLASEPLDELGLSRTELYRLIKRCLRLHADGRIYGFRALIPSKRQKEYERRDAGGNSYTGRLRELFAEHPEIEALVRNMYLKQGPFKKIPAEYLLKAIHEAFVEACKKAGIPPSAYPLATETQARESLRRYLNRLAEEHFVAVAAATGGVEAARRARTSLVNPNKQRITRPYAVVQLDGHKLDLRCVVEIPSDAGLPKRIALARFWILVAIDVASRAILGYHLCLKPEYGSEDVLYCLRNALRPWQPRALTLPGLSYAPAAGLPSGIIPECAYAAFDVLQLDNARAHLATWLQERVGEVLNCVVNVGPAGEPEDRAYIERYFGTLAKQIHRLPVTTGNRPGDRRAHAPAQTAAELNVQLDDIEQLLDVLIASYNATEHSSTGYAPLEYLRESVAGDDVLLRHLPANLRDPIPLLERWVTRTVRGGAREGGRRLYVEYEYAHYQNEVLASAESLSGKKIRLKVNDPDDLRSVEAFLPDGASLGILWAEGGWSKSRHSLRGRKRARKLLRENHVDPASVEDPIAVALKEFAARASTNAKAANAYTQMQRERHEPTAVVAGEAGEKPTGPAQAPRSDSGRHRDSRAGWQPVRGSGWVTTKKR